MIQEKKELSESEEIVKRLDAILNVLLQQPTADGKKISMLSKVEILKRSGLRNVEIAKILGLKPVTVGVVLNYLRKKGKKPKKKH